MIEKVRSFWVTGVLEKSLNNEVRLSLGLQEQPDAVRNPLALIIHEPRHASRQLPRSTQISTVFDDFGRALLILGAPGAGKTTMLLELLRDLLDQAEKDERAAIPVMFNLSSWAGKRKPLADWLIDEMHDRYDVPQEISQAWMNEEQIIPLLDGLDEVAAEHRAACIDAVNAFRDQHGLVPLAVCSRMADYEALAKQLRLPGAVVIQPLTPEQVDEYLSRAGQSLQGVRAALRSDPALWELLETPLMLSIVALAYQGRPMSDVLVLVTGGVEARRARLFATYTDAMFERRGQTRSYTRQETLRWLAWLAQSLIRHNQTVYYLEWMQPSWLVKPNRAGS
jgi:predicted NACHT family NTPase